ncbi:MAG: hypothetical protein WAW41_05885 [Methylobacter sp.]
MLLDMNVKLRRGHFDLTTRLSINDTSGRPALSSGHQPWRRPLLSRYGRIG